MEQFRHVSLFYFHTCITKYIDHIYPPSSVHLTLHPSSDTHPWTGPVLPSCPNQVFLKFPLFSHCLHGFALSSSVIIYVCLYLLSCHYHKW
jgi:hypothetical protein